jgi:hypothetical protein
MRKLLLYVVITVVVVALSAALFVYWFFSGDGLRHAIEEQATAFLGQPVKVGRARAGLFPRTAIHLSDVRVGEPARVTLAEVDISTDFRELVSRRIQDAAITIANSRIEMPLPFTIPAGGEDTPAPTSTDTSRGVVEIVSIRTIALDDIVIVSRGKEVRVSAESSLTGDRLTLRKFAARSGTTTLDADGEVDLAPRIEARIKARANKLDVDELLGLADAFTPPAQTSRTGSTPSAPMRIEARVSAETATAGGVEVRQFASDLDVNGDRVVLSPLTFQLFGGRYQGAVNAQLGNTLSLTIKSRLQDLNVAQLAAFGGAPDTISGTLTGAGTFSGSGPDVAAVLKSARGTGTATITNGAIRRLNLVRTVVLFFGRPAPDTAEGTDQFERIDASFALANQVLRAEPLALHSRDADIVGSVTLNLDSQALNGNLDLSLSEELSKQAGTDLARFTREGNRIVLPAHISGTMAAPHILIDAAAAAKRGLRNEVERRLKGFLEGLGR